MPILRTKGGIEFEVIGQFNMNGKVQCIVQLPNSVYYHSGDNLQLFKYIMLPMSEFVHDNGIENAEVVPKQEVSETA